MMRVLIVEDDPHTLAGLAEVLQSEGYDTLQASNGRAAVRMFDAERPDFVCLDIMLPELSGYDVCKQIRELDAHVPVVFISAKSEEIDKVLGLELGGDDFISKPFGMKEVVARIRAVSRRCLQSRSGSLSPNSFVMQDLEVFPQELRAVKQGETIELSLREVQLLELFHRHIGQPLDRKTILDECWGVDYFPNSRSLDQQISQLRKRIESDPHTPRIIRTVHGVGYRYDA